MVSFMHCCTSRHDTRRGASLARRVLRSLMAMLLCLLQGAAWAQEAPRALQLQVQRTSEGVFVSATLNLRLPGAVEDALRKGIAMHFVADAQVLRHRWYWSDKTQALAMRYWRLSYQPLTRRWRLAQSSEPIAASGLGVVLGQNYDDLEDALAAMQRISRWQIAEASELDADTSYTARLQYRLDTSQLPRPLQWGAVGGANWTLQLEASSPVPAASAAEPDGGPKEGS